MTHVVIDTNVLVSALLTPNGTAAAALQRALTGQWQICYNAVINAEYREVLSRPKLHINAKDRASLLNRLLSKALCVTPIPSTVPLVDEDDRIFYDTAIHTAAFLVTGNKRHYPTDPHILNPAEFIRFISR